jgi:hypothetical protein
MMLRFLRSTVLEGFKVPHGIFSLVDGGYTNTPFFLAPYCGVRYHLKEFGCGHQDAKNYKEIFNHDQVVLQNHIARDMGILKKGFPILIVGTNHTL